MDYKEMIERLKYYGTTYAIGDNLGREINGSDDLMLTAANAIETLLAERDAAVEDLAKRPHPSTCKYGEHCDYISVITGRPDCYSCDEWEWRGPQEKED